MRREVPRWQLVGYLIFFISMLIGTIWMANYASKHAPHKIDCRVARDLFGHDLAMALIDEGFGNATDKNVQTKAAYRVILTTPYCFPQSLIEIAQQNYTS